MNGKPKLPRGMFFDPAQIPRTWDPPPSGPPMGPPPYSPPPEVRAAEIIAAALLEVAKSVDRLTEAVKSSGEDGSLPGLVWRN